MLSWIFSDKGLWSQVKGKLENLDAGFNSSHLQSSLDTDNADNADSKDGNRQFDNLTTQTLRVRDATDGRRSKEGPIAQSNYTIALRLPQY